MDQTEAAGHYLLRGRNSKVGSGAPNGSMHGVVFMYAHVGQGTRCSSRPCAHTQECQRAQRIDSDGSTVIVSFLNGFIRNPRAGGTRISAEDVSRVPGECRRHACPWHDATAVVLYVLETPSTPDRLRDSTLNVSFLRGFIRNPGVAGIWTSAEDVFRIPDECGGHACPWHDATAVVVYVPETPSISHRLRDCTLNVSFLNGLIRNPGVVGIWTSAEDVSRIPDECRGHAYP